MSLALSSASEPRREKHHTHRSLADQGEWDPALPLIPQVASPSPRPILRRMHKGLLFCPISPSDVGPWSELTRAPPVLNPREQTKISSVETQSVTARKRIDSSGWICDTDTRVRHQRDSFTLQRNLGLLSWGTIGWAIPRLHHERLPCALSMLP